MTCLPSEPQRWGNCVASEAETPARKLLPLARTDPDVDVRHAAVMAVSQPTCRESVADSLGKAWRPCSTAPMSGARGTESRPSFASWSTNGSACSMRRTSSIRLPIVSPAGGRAWSRDRSWTTTTCSIRTDDEDEWGRVMDALVGAGDRTSGARSISCARLSDARPERSSEALADARCGSGVSPCATRRRAADAGDDARGRPLVRSGADRDPRERRQPRRRGKKAARGRYGGERSEICRRSFARNTSRRTEITGSSIAGPRPRVSYDVVNLVAPDEVARHASAPIVFCRNVFIYFSEQSIRRTLDAMMQHRCQTRLLLRRRIGIAAAHAHRVQSRGNRRCVRVCQGETRRETIAVIRPGAAKRKALNGSRASRARRGRFGLRQESLQGDAVAFAAGGGRWHGIGRP